MKLTTLQELKWIHDVELLGVQYDTSGDADWPIRITMRCPEDLGYEPWEGKLLVLAAIDLVGSRHVVYCVAGAETIDHINPGVSSVFRESAIKGKQTDEHFNFELTLTFISGSMLEIICQELQVEVRAGSIKGDVK
jgi:hypothetical protein